LVEKIHIPLKQPEGGEGNLKANFVSPFRLGHNGSGGEFYWAFAEAGRSEVDIAALNPRASRLPIGD